MKKLVLLLMLASGALYAADRPENEVAVASAPPLAAFAASSSNSEPSAPPLNEDEEVQLAIDASKKEADERAREEEALQAIIKLSENDAQGQASSSSSVASSAAGQRPSIPQRATVRRQANTRNVPQGNFWSGFGKGYAASVALGALCVGADYVPIAVDRYIEKKASSAHMVDRLADFRFGLGFGGACSAIMMMIDYFKSDFFKQEFGCEIGANEDEKAGIFTAAVASVLTACFLLKK